MKSNNDNKSPISSKDDSRQSVESVESDQAISKDRRDFIKKYGALAAITPVALSLTMHSQKALASSCTECGP